MSRITPGRFNTRIYSLLEAHLRAAKKPLTCVDMLEFEDVKEFTEDANRISNYLGHMWRKKLLRRHTALPSDLSMARFAYSWDPESHSPVPVKGPAEVVLTGKDEELDVTVSRHGNVIVIEGANFKLDLLIK